MIASPVARTLFVHVQKTGGKTVENLLLEQQPGAAYVQGLPGGKHATMHDAVANHPHFGDYWTFGFVRNPWARLYSWWAMIIRRGDSAQAGSALARAKIQRNAFWATVISEHRTFESFVLLGPDDLPRLNIPQLHYLQTPARKADFIGRTENFDEDLRSAFDNIGLVAPPSCHVTTQAHVSTTGSTTRP